MDKVQQGKSGGEHRDMGVKLIKDATVWDRNGSYCVAIPKKIAQKVMGLTLGSEVRLAFDTDCNTLLIQKRAPDCPEPFQKVPMVTVEHGRLVDRKDLKEGEDGSYRPKYHRQKAVAGDGGALLPAGRENGRGPADTAAAVPDRVEATPDEPS